VMFISDDLFYSITFSFNNFFVSLHSFFDFHRRKKEKLR